MAEPTVMDAINLALETGDVGNSTGEATPGPDANTDEVEGTAVGEGTGADGGDSLEEGGDQDATGSSEDDGEGGEPGGEKPGEGEHVDEGGKPGFKRDPATGKFVKLTDAETKAAADAAAAAGKPGAKPGDKPGEKKPDAVNDPIPKDVAPATQERMRTLVKMTKDLTAERDTATQSFETLVGGLQATGTTPEQYGEVLSFMALFNSTDPAQQTKALELLDGVADRLSMLLGKDRAASDPMKDHADLKDAIAKGKITPEYAREVATTRNSNKFRGELTTAHSTATAEANAKAEELQTARSDLNTLENTLKATDPQYGAKRAVLVPILKTIFKSLPPSQWKAKFEETYKTIRVPSAGGTRPGIPARQPMRAGGGGGASAGGGGNNGGMATKAGSALEALSAAIGSMPRGR